MFENALLVALQADTTLASYLSAFGGKPSVFSNFAPETADLPYVVFRIERTNTESSAIMRFNLYVDVYGYNTTRKTIRDASNRIEYLLDRAELSSARYSNIRLFFFSGGPVDDEDDPRSIHENLLFDCRAGRLEWCSNITTVGS